MAPAWENASLVNRLRRFLGNSRVSVRDYYRPVAESLVSAFRGLPIRLIIDTTKFGFNARLLTGSIAYRKRALPLAWSVHRGKKGWLAIKEQIALLRQVAELIPKASEVWLLGDCEFQHVPLLSWLKKQGWHCVLRQQGRAQVWQPGRAQVSLASLGPKEGETRYLGWVRLAAKYHYGLGWGWEGVELLAKVYDDPNKASEELDFVTWLLRERSINILNAAVLARDEDGKTSLKEAGDLDARQGRLLGAITGGRSWGSGRQADRYGLLQ